MCLTSGKNCTQRSATEVERLVLENMGLVHWVINGMIRRGVIGLDEEEDMHQEAVLALTKAAKAYDPGRGMAFSTLAVNAIQRHIKNIHIKKLRIKREGEKHMLSLDAPIWRGIEKDQETTIAYALAAEDDTEAEAQGRMLAEAIMELIPKVLNVRGQQWLLRYAAGESFVSIAKSAGVTKQAVCTCIQRSQHKLRAELARRGLME